MKEYVTVIENPNPRDEVTEGKAYLLETIRTSKQFKNWTLYERPMLNSMQPDFILLHPRKGILIIEVKAWHLESPEYMENGQVQGANGHYFTDNPVDHVNAYKDLILKYELDTFIEAMEHQGDKAFEMITPVVYFHDAPRDKAMKFVGDIDSMACLIWTKTDLEELCSVDVIRDDQRFPPVLFMDRSKFSRGPERFMQKLVANLEDMLRPNENALNKKRPLTLTSEQSKLVPIHSGSNRRWGGVAGSGKTVVIATKATEAIKKGQRVLVLTYNITLRHYIRDFCSQQFVGTNRALLKSHLTIAHFHGFLKILLVELGMQAPSGSVEAYPEWSMDLILEKVNARYPEHLRYDSILIDEGQDFSGDWIRFLKNIYTHHGELLVMYDEAQSIYEDKGVWITDSEEIEGIGFRGQVGHLSITHRLPNGIVHQIDRLSELFGVEKKLDATSEQIDLFTDIKWKNIDVSDNRTALIKDRVDSILSKKISTIDNITVITMNESTGIDVVNAFEASGSKVSHVYDMNGTKTESQRSDEKWKFQPGIDRLKVSSYHSYKGWESSHVILLLEAMGSENHHWKNMLDALYISLTRVSAFSNSRSFLCINNYSEFNKVGKYFE